MNLPSEHHQYQPPPISLTPRTGVSIGLVVLVIAGVLWIGNRLSAIEAQGFLTQSQIKSEAASNQSQNAAMRQEFMSKFQTVENNIIALQQNKEGVTKFDFLRWAVHLQQLNNEPKKLQLEGLKVPELDTK